VVTLHDLTIAFFKIHLHIVKSEQNVVAAKLLRSFDCIAVDFLFRQPFGIRPQLTSGENTANVSIRRVSSVPRQALTPPLLLVLISIVKISNGDISKGIISSTVCIVGEPDRNTRFRLSAAKSTRFRWTPLALKPNSTLSIRTRSGVFSHLHPPQAFL